MSWVNTTVPLAARISSVVVAKPKPLRKAGLACCWLPVIVTSVMRSSRAPFHVNVENGPSEEPAENHDVVGSPSIASDGGNSDEKEDEAETAPSFVASTFCAGVPAGVGDGGGDVAGLEAEGVVSEGVAAGLAAAVANGTGAVSAGPLVRAGRSNDWVGSAMLTRVKTLMTVGGGTTTMTAAGVNPGHAVPV